MPVSAFAHVAGVVGNVLLPVVMLPVPNCSFKTLTNDSAMRFFSAFSPYIVPPRNAPKATRMQMIIRLICVVLCFIAIIDIFIW